MTIDFLEDILFSPNLLPAEHKIAGQLLRLLTMDETKKNSVDLNLLLLPPEVIKYIIVKLFLFVQRILEYERSEGCIYFIKMFFISVDKLLGQS